MAIIESCHQDGQLVLKSMQSIIDMGKSISSLIVSLVLAQLISVTWADKLAGTHSDGEIH